MLDNVRLRQFGLDPDPKTARLFRALADADRETLYRLMLQKQAIDHAEALASAVESSSLDRETVAELARWLAEAADREPVKYALAEDILPLDRIASGPSESCGLGEEFKSHSCLVMELPRRDQNCARLVGAALRSPVTHHRYTANRVLEGDAAGRRGHGDPRARGGGGAGREVEGGA